MRSSEINIREARSWERRLRSMLRWTRPFSWIFMSCVRPERQTAWACLLNTRIACDERSVHPWCLFWQRKNIPISLCNPTLDPLPRCSLLHVCPWGRPRTNGAVIATITGYRGLVALRPSVGYLEIFGASSSALNHETGRLALALAPTCNYVNFLDSEALVYVRNANPGFCLFCDFERFDRYKRRRSSETIVPEGRKQYFSFIYTHSIKGTQIKITHLDILDINRQEMSTAMKWTEIKIALNSMKDGKMEDKTQE